MNRIIVGRSNKEIGVITKDKIVIDINTDTRLLIENEDFKECVININGANLNILSIREKQNNIHFNINVNGGSIILNNVSYDSGDTKMIINLNNEESKALVYNSVIAKDKVIYDMRINHNEKNTNSDIYNNGITKENGSICFNVFSHAPKNSKYCKINQTSKIISLNDKNENKINPILLIDEFETEARHAAFVGNFNELELFYLMSRGLSVTEAKNLLINGLLIGTLNICFNEKENLKKKLNKDWR